MARNRKHPARKPYRPTTKKVANILDSVRAVCNLPISLAAPRWLDGDPGLDPFEIVACRNGLLHIPTRRLLPATPRLFILNGLEFDYDPEAPPPANWLNFLDQLGPTTRNLSRRFRNSWVTFSLPKPISRKS
jgi:putative DNA primase/helicase